MKCKHIEKVSIPQVKIEKSITNERLSSYSGLLGVYSHIDNMSISRILDSALPTIRHSATKFSNQQILLAICRHLCVIQIDYVVDP